MHIIRPRADPEVVGGLEGDDGGPAAEPLVGGSGQYHLPPPKAGHFFDQSVCLQFYA